MTEATPLMAAKKGLIMGVANERSIAWGIARAVQAHGAELAFTYQGDAFGKRVRPLAESIGSSIVLDCDVSNEASMASVFSFTSANASASDFSASLFPMGRLRNTDSGPQHSDSSLCFEGRTPRGFGDSRRAAPVQRGPGAYGQRPHPSRRRRYYQARRKKSTRQTSRSSVSSRVARHLFSEPCAFPAPYGSHVQPSRHFLEWNGQA